MGEIDIDFLNKRNVNYLALVWGIPDHLVGCPDPSTYSNYEQARRSFEGKKDSTDEIIREIVDEG